MKQTRLICTIGGSNKYYQLDEKADGRIMITYGRIDKTTTTIYKEMWEWDNIIRSKIKKGYRDVSTSKLSLKDIFAELDKLESKIL